MAGTRVVIVGKRSNLTGALVSRLDACTVVASGDIGSLSSHLSPSEPVDIVVNAFVKSSLLRANDRPQDYSKYGFDVLSELISVCRANPRSVRTLVYTSSSSVYGDNSLASELDHCEVRSLYPAMKLASELFIQHYLMDTPIRVIIPRVFNMYGGNDEFSIVAKIAHALKAGSEISIVNDGEAIRDFISIDDVVDVYAALLGSNYQGLINVGTGMGMSVRRVIEAAEKAFGIRLKIKPTTSSEIRVSIAATARLQDLMPGHRFRSVEHYYSGLVSKESPTST